MWPGIVRSRAVDVLVTAQRRVDDLLFPRALATDQAAVVPAENLDALAAAGLYGLVASPDAGGQSIDFPTMLEVLEVVASGCLTTAFVWLQHHGPVRALLEAPDHLRDHYLPSLVTGERRAGIAWGGLRDRE